MERCMARPRTNFAGLKLAGLVAMLSLATFGCSGYRAYRQAETAAQLGNWDEAVVAYMRALELEPANVAYRADLLRAKIRASQEHFKKGREFKKAGVLDRALVELQEAVQLDPTNQFAQTELDSVRRALAAERGSAPTIEQLKQKNRGSRPQPPLLNPRSNQLISLEFPQPVSIFEIYRALGKAYGINILFDPNLQDKEIAIELKDVTAKDALEILMRSAAHFYKVMDEQTVLIAADTPQNRRTYEDLVIQTFFLSNSEVKEMTTILRSLIDARKIATNEQLNAIILRDTADKVKVAEKIIQSNDKSKAEVVVDVELLQVDSGNLHELGVSLSANSIGQSLDLGGSGDNAPRLRLSDLQFLNQSNWILTIPSITYNFMKQSSDAQILAKPQLRISEGEKASLVIGDRVPIPLTQFSAQAPGQGGGVITAPITSFQYQDVGIRMDIEPRVHHNGEITLKIKVEVSDITRQIQSPGGGSQPVISTRTIDTTIRLKDGETNFLAGLLRNDEKGSQSGLPGLSEIPVLGRLFSNKRTENSRSDVILTLTPHIVRNAEITEDDLLPISVGTEANISFRGATPQVESNVEGPFDGNDGTPEEVQDAIRRRLQRLPRGLRPEDAGGEVQDPNAPPAQIQQAPPTFQFAPPSQAPTDIFRQPATKEGQEEVIPEEPPSELGALEDELGSDIVAASISDDGRLFVARRADTVTAVGGGSIALAATSAAEPSPTSAPSGVVAGSSDGEASVRLSLVPQRAEVAPGDRFQLSIEASSLEPLSHLPFALRFDPAILVVERIDAGEFLGGAAESQVLSDVSRPGEVVIGASRLGRVAGVAGAGTVARITFRALAQGSSEITFFQAEAKGGDLRSVGPVSVKRSRIEVKDEPREGRDPVEGIEQRRREVGR